MSQCEFEYVLTSGSNPQKEADAMFRVDAARTAKSGITAYGQLKAERFPKDVSVTPKLSMAVIPCSTLN